LIADYCNSEGFRSALYNFGDNPLELVDERELRKVIDYQKKVDFCWLLSDHVLRLCQARVVVLATIAKLAVG
jgi:hypothetical protein